LFADGISPLPIWQREVGLDNDNDYAFPRINDTVRRFNVGVTKWAARHGVAAPSNPNIQGPKSRLEKEALRRKSFSLAEFMLEEAKRFLAGMRVLWVSISGYEKPSDLVHRMITAWESLRLRATSHEDDKFVCFVATCAIGYKQRTAIQDLLSYPPEQRMKFWIQTQSVVPAGLLFIPGERYNEKGSQWVPKGVWRQPLVDKDCAVREQGTNELVFKKPGFIIHAGPCYADPFLISDDASSLQYSVALERPGLWNSTTFPSYGQLGIVMRQMIGQRPPGYDEYKETGALIGNARTVDAKVYGEFICRVEVQLFTTGEQGDGGAVFSARALDQNHGWVIS
jgi:hypothetical protein